MGRFWGTRWVGRLYHHYCVSQGLPTDPEECWVCVSFPFVAFRTLFLHCTARNENHAVLWRHMVKTVGHDPCEDRETQSQTRKNNIGLDDEVREFGNLKVYSNCAIRCMVWTPARDSALAGLAPLVRASPCGIHVGTTQTDIMYAVTYACRGSAMSSRPISICCGDCCAHRD